MTRLMLTRCGAWLVAAACAVIPAALGACSSADTPAVEPSSDDVIEYELFPNTVQLDETAIAALQPETVTQTLVFVNPPASLDGLRTRNVILAGASEHHPRGLLRLVREVRREGDKLTVTTMTAPVQLAFRRLKVQVKRETPAMSELGKSASPHEILSAPMHPMADLVEGAIGDSQTFDFYPFDGDKNPATTQDQIHVGLELKGALAYKLSIDFDWGLIDDPEEALLDCFLDLITIPLFGACDEMLPEANFKFDIESSVEVGATMDGAAYRTFATREELPEIPLPPVPVGPILLTPGIVVFAEASGQASSRFKVGARAGVDFGGSLTASTSGDAGFSGFIPDPMFDAPTPEVELQANGVAKAGVELKIMLYDVAGATAGVAAYARLAADQLAEPCWTLHGGVEASVGLLIEVEITDDISYTLVEERETFPIAETQLASGGCELPPDDGPVVPGSGPTNETLLNPSFTPWARAYTTGAVTFPHTVGVGLRPTRLTQSVDGNWILGATWSRALSKVDSTGGLVWGYEYWRDDLRGPSDRPMLITHVAHAADATMFVATYPPGIMKLGQAGGVAWAESFDLGWESVESPYGDGKDEHRFTGVAEDGNGGMLLVGTHRPDEDSAVRGWVLHVDPNGQVLQSYMLNDALDVYPTVVLQTAEGWFISGFVWDVSDVTKSGFMLLMREDGTIAWSKHLVASRPGGTHGCEPSTGILHSGGDVVLGGGTDHYYQGFLARVGLDGTLRFGTPFGVQDLSSSTLAQNIVYGIKELSTTGLLVTGGNEETFVANFDAVGNPNWRVSYDLLSTDSDPLMDAETAYTSIALTDDGGAMLLSYSTYLHGTSDKRSGYWLQKVFARDGTANLSSSLAKSAPGATDVDIETTLLTPAWTPTVTAFEVTPTDRTVTPEQAEIEVTTQSLP